jgi:SAM-dependent methyltransferase
MRKLTKEYVVWAYRLLLGREPENTAIVDTYSTVFRDPRELVWEFILSEEFQAKNKELKISLMTPDFIPIPPSRLIDLVAGNLSIFWFLEGGILAKQAIFNLLDKNGFDFNQFSNVLDFGCGCGRVIRNWHSFSPNFYGTDYNMELIEWCKNNLNFCKFSINNLEPPINYPDDKFDFIYALSVFTHLPKILQIPWLEEMKRILKPNGVIFISVHGDHYKNLLTRQEKQLFEQGELIIHREEIAGSNTCNAFHPRQYIMNNFSKVMKVIDIVPEGALGNPYQDAILLQKI